MKARKQISLEELFRLYPQLQPAPHAEAVPQGVHCAGHEGRFSPAETAVISNAEA